MLTKRLCYSRIFQLLIDAGTLVPGWHKGQLFSFQGSASHVSAATLVDPHAPGSLRVALHHANPNRLVWTESYREEYEGITSNSTFDVISEDDYVAHCRRTGTKAIPSMVVFTVKHDSSGRPVREKSRIAVLGNKDPTQLTKADCYAPVASITVVRFFTAFAVSKQCTLKQGGVKMLLSNLLYLRRRSQLFALLPAVPFRLLTRIGAFVNRSMAYAARPVNGVIWCLLI